MRYKHTDEEVYEILGKAVNQLTQLIRELMDKNLLEGKDPQHTMDLYLILGEVMKLYPKRLFPVTPVKPPGPPTITHAAPSPQGPNGEIEDPLAELEESPASK